MQRSSWTWVWLISVGCVASSAVDRTQVPPPEPTEPSATSAPDAAPPEDPLVATLNLDFERVADGKPAGWMAGGEGYAVTVVDDDSHTGERSLRFEYVEAGQAGIASTRFPVDQARGKRLRLTGYLRTVDVEAGWAGLWMRVDGLNRKMLALDNMQSRGVTGTTPWTQYEILLSVPEDATGVVFGALLVGSGTAWADTLRFEVIGPVDDAPIDLAGTVVDREGKPVAGALVALVSPNTHYPAATAASDAGGHFALNSSPGEYAITATAPGLRGAYVKARRYDESNGELRLAMDGDAFTHTGTVLDEFGEPIAGALVGLFRYSMETGDIWYTRTAADGSFSFTVMPADKLVAFFADDSAYAEETGLSGRADQRIELQAVRIAPAPAEVVDWIRRRAIPLTAVEAGNGFSDMNGLRKLIGKARVVALGEATHGTREFFQMKHRMLEFLVEKMGFTVFAIEANFSESLAVNEYVLHGAGNAREALDGIYFWTWNTKEVLALIEWMRAYNADPQHKRKLEFYGFDMQFGAVAAVQLLHYFEAVDPTYAASVATELDAMQSEPYLRENAESLSEPIAGFVRQLEDNRKRYERASDRAAWRIARQNARVLEQQRKMNASKADPSFEARDEAMAANVRWILDSHPKHTRVVVWAHNGHVSKSPLQGLKSMGTHLHEDLGKAYVAFGFAFNRGGFQAVDANSERLTEIEVGPAPEDAVGATFARAGCSICVLDLRRLPRRSKAATWFGRPRRMREIGAMYAGEDNMLSPQPLPSKYDALIFIDETTRARPLE